MVQKAVGASPYVLANNFSHSLLKKRIRMMCRGKSGKWQRAKALYVLPVALLALSAFATPEFKKASETIEDVVKVASEELPLASLRQEEPASVPEAGVVMPHVQPVVIEQDTTLDIRTEEGLEPLIVIDGEIRTREDALALDVADVENVTVFKGVSATAIYGDKGKDGAIVIETKAYKGTSEAARFPGNMHEWVARNVVYPQEAQALSETGRIIVSFTVEADGSLTEISSIDNEAPASSDGAALGVEDCDGSQDGLEDGEQLQARICAARRALQDEAERVVRTMPKWHPATQDGVPTRVRMTLPITFNLY